MMQASPPAAPVTAAQVLDAAQRAEAEGRLESAVQYYRHLFDNHRGAPEAIAARDALARIVQARPGAAPVRVRPPSSPAPAKAGRNSSPQAASEPLPATAEPRPRPPIRIAPAGSRDPRRALVLPRPAPGYVAGRVIAHAATSGGVLLAVLAAALPLSAALGPGPWSHWPLWQGLAANPLAAPVAFLAALGLVLVGQAARAMFDAAAATRELAAIERAKADHYNQGYR